MRTPRIAILVLFSTATLFLFFRSVFPSSRPSPNYASSKPRTRKSVWGNMYYNTPFSFFPPNAAISLTDDNSTSFAARPAAFGPKLAPKGLSGQLWVGSGFAEDTLEGQGELGCSDLPGWDYESRKSALRHSLGEVGPQGTTTSEKDALFYKRRQQLLDAETRGTTTRSKNAEPKADDGTDNYLRELNGVVPRKARIPPEDSRSPLGSSEIDGKIALLMRGGCGFLDKVLWAQRRGAIAVIVGDNQKGGPLIQMFAHGEDVDNITIPSVFTARTTAHLLSSLTQAGSFIEESVDANGNHYFKVSQGGSKVEAKKKQSAFSRIKHSMRSKSVPNRRTGKSGISKEASSALKEETLPSTAVKSIKQPTTSDHIDDEEASSRSTDSPEGFFSKIFKDHTEGLKEETPSAKARNERIMEDMPFPDSPEDEVREGLWVTITPTSSASPFFDTLLVLVISPLVTLTVVYALLIIRARIRRRRWRAPKSVVDRLPVRTYHTVASSPTLTPRMPSPRSSSPTTPLLQETTSRTRLSLTGGQSDDENLLSPSSPVPTPVSAARRSRQEREKGSAGFSAEWKKYMGRQVECVVCLEEYVDGVSQVMSLPCGHEFHVDCITPWLTTRRRTCPICKGDVVRSLARRTSSTPRYEPYRDDSDDDDTDTEAEGSGSRDAEEDADLEQGLLSPEPRSSRTWSQNEGWLSLFSSSANTRAQNRSRSPEDRTR